MSVKARAFAAIRDVIGPETCPAGRRLKGYLPLEMRDDIDAVVTTNQHLREALAALLVGGDACSLCEQSPCNAKCHRKRLLAAMEAS